MASSGSSGLPNSGSKGFDFASDDILCSYEDYGAQDRSNGNLSDPTIGVGPSKDIHKNRMARSSACPVAAYSLHEGSFSQDVISTVDRTMKKYADNLMRFLEGISSRMSQLELYCYNLDKSIGEMRSDLVRDHGEADTKLKSLEKHLQEVHRSIQILRDKQELAEAQKELSKLQFVQKESSSASHSKQNEDRASSSSSDLKKTDSTSDVNNQQLALALPHQVPPQPSLPTRPLEQQQPMTPHSHPPPQSMSQHQSYYLPPTSLPNPSAQVQHPQGQYMLSDPRYQTPSLQDSSRVSRMAPQAAESQVSQAPPVNHFPQYQQQWPPQIPQQPSVQPQTRPPSSTVVYPSYPSQPANPSIPDTLPNSTPLQVPFSGFPQQGASRAEVMPYGYGGAARPVPQPQPPQHVKGTFGAQPGDGCPVSRPHPTLSTGNAYMVYEAEGPRAHHSQQSPFPHGGYPPTSANIMVRNSSPPQLLRNTPYTDLIEKLVSMGYRVDHVVAVIQRMEESGQPVDFNSVLDRLNGLSSGGSQRGGW